MLGRRQRAFERLTLDELTRYVNRIKNRMDTTGKGDASYMSVPHLIFHCFPPIANDLDFTLRYASSETQHMVEGHLNVKTRNEKSKYGNLKVETSHGRERLPWD